MKIERIICDLCKMDGREPRTAVATYWNVTKIEWDVCLEHLEDAKEAGMEYRMLAEEVDEV